MIAVAIVFGSALRWLFRDYTTSNTFAFVLPWYAFVHHHGLQSLPVTFTNYTPFYSYLLIAAAQFGGLAKPLFLIKCISFAFELGCATLAYRLARLTGAPAFRAALAFAAIWLAPTVLYNGALWSEADSLWTFFVLWSVYLFCRGQNGVPAFGMAFAVKAQGVFLGPFVLAMALRNRKYWPWLAAIPAIYVFVALPVILAGGSVRDVLTVYLNQAGTFHFLAVNVANPWNFVPTAYYGPGVIVGLALAAAGGLAIAVFIATRGRRDPEFLLLAASATLLMMPFLLPKMHDRFFYAFEISSIVLACANPRFAAFAVIAQVDGVLSYLAFDRNMVLGLSAAAFCNGVMLVFLLRELGRDASEPAFPLGHWIGYSLLAAAVFGLLFQIGAAGRSSPMIGPYYGAVGLLVAQTVALLDRTARRTNPGPGRSTEPRSAPSPTTVRGTSIGPGRGERIP
jgi:Gpi18-like mannosyltransferase